MSYQPHSLDVTRLEPRPILYDITIVIPTLGRPILEECLHWIVSGSAWPGGLVVVDQGRKPRIAAWIESLRTLRIDAEYIPSSQRGPSAGVNRGLERVKTKFVAIIDDDCFVENRWLENMTDHLRRDPLTIVTGRVEAGTEEVLVVATSEVRSVQRRPRLTFDHMSGGNMGTSSAVLQRVGLFDEDSRLVASEDGEFAYRALRAGVPIHYEPDVIVLHYGWRDDDQRQHQYRDYAYGHGVFYGKYLRQGDWFILLRVVAHYLRASRRWVRGAMKRDREMRSFSSAYLTRLMPGIVAGMRGGYGE